MNAFDLAIIGGGPAGAAAAVYSARKQLKTILIAESFGGQSVESAEIQNWIGTEKIGGAELAKQLESHVRAYAGESLVIKTGQRASSVIQTGDGFVISVGADTFEARTVLITTGGVRRKLDVPGAAEFENKGVVYCASCDGPLFADMDVAVIGGGNAGFETAAQLLAYAKSVTLIHRSSDFKADPITVEKVLSHKNMRAMTETEPIEVRGSKFVESLTVLNKKSGEKHEIPVSGVFVEIGMYPSTDLVKNLLELDQYGRIIVDPKNQRASVAGVWAAGDVTNGLYHQNNIAAGDAVKALEDIYLYVKAK